MAWEELNVIRFFVLCVFVGVLWVCCGAVLEELFEAVATQAVQPGLAQLLEIYCCIISGFVVKLSNFFLWRLSMREKSGYANGASASFFPVRCLQSCLCFGHQKWSIVWSHRVTTKQKRSLT